MHPATSTIGRTSRCLLLLALKAPLKVGAKAAEAAAAAAIEGNRPTPFIEPFVGLRHKHQHHNKHTSVRVLGCMTIVWLSSDSQILWPERSCCLLLPGLQHKNKSRPLETYTHKRLQSKLDELRYTEVSSCLCFAPAQFGSAINQSCSMKRTQSFEFESFNHPAQFQHFTSNSVRLCSFIGVAGKQLKPQVTCNNYFVLLFF